MGKADILSHQGSGFYLVRISYNERRAQETIDHLQERIARIKDRLQGLAEAREDAESKAEDARDDVDQAIQDWVAAQGTSEEPEKREDLLKAQQAYIQARSEHERAAVEHELWRVERVSAERRIQLIERNLPSGPSREIQIPCVDYTTNLSGEVGTIEPLGLGDTVLVRPGYDDAAVHDPSKDGEMTPVISQTAAQTLYNYMMLPGWQKWQPLYRTGTIKNVDVDNDKGDVKLDGATSPSQGLNVNQSKELSSIPIRYMACHSLAFEEDDHVVVQFLNRDWNSPRIIGFADGPRPCEFYLRITINGYDCTQSHRVGLLDADTGEAIDEQDTDSSGVVGPLYLGNYKAENVVPALHFSGGPYGALFSHYREANDLPATTAGFRYNYISESSDFWNYTDSPDQMSDDHGYYTFEILDGDQDIYNGGTVHLYNIRWLWSESTLQEFSTKTLTREDGTQVLGYVVPIDGAKTVRHRRVQAWTPPILSSWNEQEVVGSGHFRMRNPDESYNTRFYDKDTLANKWKIAVTQGLSRTNESASKIFDHSYIEAREQILHDTYTITFTSGTDFELTLMYFSGSWFGSTDQDFAPTDPATEDPILFIPKEAWGDSTWEDGDTVSWSYGLALYDLYRDNSKSGEETEWKLVEPDLSTGSDFTHTYTDSDGIIYDDYTIKRDGWRGAFAAGDEIVFVIQGAQKGIVVCGDDIPGDTIFYEETEFLTTMTDYHETIIPAVRKTSHITSDCPRHFYPTADVKDFPDGIVDDECSYPEYGKGPVDALQHSSYIWRHAQNYDASIDPHSLFPVSDDKGHNPQMAGFTIKQEIQNVWYQLWASWIDQSSNTTCAEGTFAKRNDTEYMDFETSYIEMIDVPQEWI